MSPPGYLNGKKTWRQVDHNSSGQFCPPFVQQTNQDPDAVLPGITSKSSPHFVTFFLQILKQQISCQ